jgi:hypothetical protein
MKDDRVYLEFILESLGEIHVYTQSGSAAFFEDRKTQLAVLRRPTECSCSCVHEYRSAPYLGDC